MKKIPIWIDADTGVDDSIAILCAIKTPELDIVGMSAVAGNVELVHTFQNTRDIVSFGGREDIKVYKGADKPLLRQLHPVHNIHGENGIGDVKLAASKADIEKENACDALYKKACELNGELTVVATGPLTNIATTIVKYPDFISKIKQIAIMGGALIGGNITPCAEFNVITDPEAAQTVFKCGAKIIMCGLDVTLKAYLTYDEVNIIGSFDNPQSKYFKEATPSSIKANETFVKGYVPHDLCPLWYLVYPELFETIETSVYVETRGSFTTGKTVTDYWNGDGKLPKNDVTAVMNVDRDKFANKIIETFKNW